MCTISKAYRKWDGSMSLATILWDAGGVIYGFDQTKCDRKLAADCGHTPEEVSTMLFGGSAQGKEYNAGLVEALNLGKINPKMFYDFVKERLGLSMPYEKFAEAWSDIFTLNNEIVHYMGLAQRLGVKQGVLSSTNPLHWRKMNSIFDLEELLGKNNVMCTFHRDAGYKKPAPQLFDAALRRLECTKEETVYVDDVEKYVKAAQEYGMGDALHVDNAQENFQRKCIISLQQRGFPTLYGET